MKKVFVVLVLLIILTLPVNANDFIFNSEGGDNITIVSDKGTIKGQTEENYKIIFNGEEKIVGENGNFVFSNLDPNSYSLKIYDIEDNLIYEKEIEIEGNETIDLGEVGLKEKEESIDISNNEGQVDFEKANQNSNKGQVFLIEGLSFENQFSILKVNYRHDLSIGDDYRSTYSSSGYLNEIKAKLPIKFDKFNIELGIDYGTFSADNANEIEYNNGTRSNVYMVDPEGNYVNLKGSVFFDIENIGRIKGFLGPTFYKNTFEKSSFNSGSGEFNKIYYDGGGFVYGFAFDTYIGDYFNENDDNPLQNVLIGVEFSRSENDIKVSSTDIFTSFNTTGYKNTLDFYIGYRKNFDIKIGYKSIEYFAEEYVENNFVYPNLSLDFQGVYVSLGMDF